MKRSMIVGLAIVAMLGIVTTIALASKAAPTNALDDVEPVESVFAEDVDLETAVTQEQEQPTVPTGQNFVDDDGDGVCDTCGSVPNSGVGNQYGNGAMGGSFVDEDGDGVCDTCGNVPNSGVGNQNGNGAMGSNFVDADGDGVCDTCGLAPADGTGNQHGRQGNHGGQGNQGNQNQGGGQGHGGHWDN